jgi:hypothetical protein
LGTEAKNQFLIKYAGLLYRVRLFRSVSLIYFFTSKRKKIPYFSLSFDLSEYEHRTLYLPHAECLFLAVAQP